MDQIKCFNSLPERIKKKVVVCSETGCWNWTAYKDKYGYGRVGNGTKRVKLAHRFVFEMVNGEINHSLVIDHLCKNRACVNPFHMEQVSIRENTMRGTSFSVINKFKDICSNGHVFTKENTYTRPDGNRDCRTCIRNRVARYQAKQIRRHESA